MSHFTIQEHSSTLASQPTTIRPAVGNQFPAPIVQGSQKKPQGSGVTVPSKERDVFGGDSNSSLTSDSEREEIPAQNTWTRCDGAEEIDPLARESPAAGRYPFYDDNNDLYDDEANANMVDHPAGEDDLYADDERDARMDIDWQGFTSDQEFPTNLDDGMFKEILFCFTDYIAALDPKSDESDEQQDQNKDGDRQISPQHRQPLPPARVFLLNNENSLLAVNPLSPVRTSLLSNERNHLALHLGFHYPPEVP